MYYDKNLSDMTMVSGPCWEINTVNFVLAFLPQHRSEQTPPTTSTSQPYT